MTKNQFDRNQSEDINRMLGIDGDSGNRLSQAALGNGESKYAYKPWYASLLSTLVIAAAGEEIVFAQGTFSAEDSELIDVYVITSARVIYSSINLNDVTARQTTARAVPRSSLKGLVISASARIDDTSARALAWPGRLLIKATFKGLPTPFEVEGEAYSQLREQMPMPIFTLLRGLQADLISK
jgi:hypothetical protein